MYVYKIHVHGYTYVHYLRIKVENTISIKLYIIYFHYPLSSGYIEPDNKLAAEMSLLSLITTNYVSLYYHCCLNY